MTTEDFLQEHNEISHFFEESTQRMVCFDDDVKKAMIEFTKLHVKLALEAASKQATATWNQKDGCVVDKDSILNSYPESNII